MTCREYGAQVLSHPFIVDAAEELFVPLCIYNNTAGDDDARVREAFKEPPWNNPVVRIVDKKKNDVVERVADDWSLKALLSAMVRALKEKGTSPPPYLLMLLQEEEAKARGVGTAVFGMP